VRAAQETMLRGSDTGRHPNRGTETSGAGRDAG